MKRFSNKGFSLLEILIAIAILAFISMGVYQTVNQSTMIKERITSEDKDFLQVEAFFARFDTDFSQIYSPLYFSPRAVKKNDSNDGSVSYESEVSSQRFEGKADNGLPIPNVDGDSKGKLIFMTSSHRRRVVGSKESDYTWISYELKNASEENKAAPFVIIRNYQPSDVYAKSFKWDENKEQTVLKNVKDFEFGFWDESKKSFLTSTRELGDANKNLIRLIRIRLVWVDKDGGEKKYEKTFRPLWPYYKALNSTEEMNKTNMPSAPGVSTSGANENDDETP